MRDEILKKEKEINEYLEEWVTQYYHKWTPFYHDVNRNKQSFRAQIKGANTLLDLMDDIIGNIEGHFAKEESQHIIPTCFPSIESLMDWMVWMKEWVKKKIPLIESNRSTDFPNYYMDHLSSMVWELTKMIERCEKNYATDSDMPAPFHRLRKSLLNEDVEEFIDILKSILESIPSSIRKEKYNESHYHISVHTIMTILGFDVISEMSTDIGRIDLVLRLYETAYIFEFKYADMRPSAKKGLEQIEKMEYYESLKLKAKKIIGVGVAFSGERRNIVEHCSKVLYEKANQ